MWLQKWSYLGQGQDTDEEQQAKELQWDTQMPQAATCSKGTEDLDVATNVWFLVVKATSSRKTTYHWRAFAKSAARWPASRR